MTNLNDIQFLAKLLDSLFIFNKIMFQIKNIFFFGLLSMATYRARKKLVTCAIWDQQQIEKWNTEFLITFHIKHLFYFTLINIFYL